MLAVAGASYQGVFSNPLADPYLLGVASGAGLGATVVIIEGPSIGQLPADALPVAAFAGAVVAVAATFALGRARAAGPVCRLDAAGRRGRGRLFHCRADVPAPAEFPRDLSVVYSWILGGPVHGRLGTGR